MSAHGSLEREVHLLITAWAHQQGNYKFQTASYALYCYDHLLVFSDEVEKIWKRPFTFASLLYVLNRYITHVQFVAIQVGFYETTWSSEQCDRFVKFPGAGTIIVFAVAEMTMILRMYALYGMNKWILCFLLAVLVGQVTIMGICLRTGVRVDFPRGFPGCVLTSTAPFFGAFWAAPLVSDTCIFALTLLRICTYRKARVRVPIAQQILRDGILYFLVIFYSNLLNVMLYWCAPPDLTALGASFTHVMTSLMVARLHLNLRSAHGGAAAEHPAERGGGGHLPRAAKQAFFTLGNLGEDVEDGTVTGRAARRAKSRRWVQAGLRDIAVSYVDMEAGSQEIPLRPMQPLGRTGNACDDKIDIDVYKLDH